jgi:hypothetical protein
MRWYFSALCHQQLKEAQLGGCGDKCALHCIMLPTNQEISSWEQKEMRAVKWALQRLTSLTNEEQAGKETLTRLSSFEYMNRQSLYYFEIDMSL